MDGIISFVEQNWFLLVLLGILACIMLRNKKVFKKQDDMMERQKESLATLKEMTVILKEISQKLDRK